MKSKIVILFLALGGSLINCAQAYRVNQHVITGYLQIPEKVTIDDSGNMKLDVVLNKSFVKDGKVVIEPVANQVVKISLNYSNLLKDTPELQFKNEGEVIEINVGHKIFKLIVCNKYVGQKKDITVDAILKQAYFDYSFNQSLKEAKALNGSTKTVVAEKKDTQPVSKL